MMRANMGKVGKAKPHAFDSLWASTASYAKSHISQFSLLCLYRYRSSHHSPVFLQLLHILLVPPLSLRSVNLRASVTSSRFYHYNESTSIHALEPIFRKLFHLVKSTATVTINHGFRAENGNIYAQLGMVRETTAEAINRTWWDECPSNIQCSKSKRTNTGGYQ